MRVPAALARWGAAKLAVKFGVAESTARRWLAEGAPADRARALRRAAARSRGSRAAARVAKCRAALLALGRQARSYEERGVSGEFFDKETLAVFASAADGTTLRLQMLVGESGRRYPQWAASSKLDGYENDAAVNFSYQNNLRRSASRLQIFFPECAARAVRERYEASLAEAEYAYADLYPGWLRHHGRAPPQPSRRRSKKVR